VQKVSERLDKSGNIINPKTKQVIQPKDEYMPPKLEEKISVEEFKEELSAVQIQQKILEHENEIARLKELRNKKIAEMQKQLEMLQNL
jgi:hypothetical protein